MVIGDIHPEFGQIFIAMGGMGVNIVEHLIRPGNIPQGGLLLLHGTGL